MSDFLVNLARRSAGLAPVVHARSGPPPMASESSSEAVAAPTLWREAPQAPIVVALPSAAPSQAMVDTPRSAVPPVPLQVASAPAPVVQRAPALDHAAPVLPATPVAPAASVATGAPTAPVRVEPALRERVVVHTVTRAAPESPASPHERARASAEPVSAPIPPAFALPATDPPLAVPVTIQPAEVAAPAIRLPTVEPVPERTVNVRIGAIEIYGADSGAAKATPPDMSIAAVAAPASNATSAGGFDDYAALRSYAPWSW